jgi:predicted RNA methylase
MKEIVISPEVADVLKRSTATAESLVLPGNLERKLYQDTNKVIEMAGGVWNKKAKAHLFTSDPRERLGLALKSGKAVLSKEHSAPKLKEAIRKKEGQMFFTPPALAARVARMAEVARQVVLEPSAGRGALADACKLCKAKEVHCLDIDEVNREALLNGGHVVCGGDDFLGLVPGPSCCLESSYTRIVMNPPFTKNQDVTHVKHALQFLAPKGRLVAIMAGNKTRKPFVELLARIEHLGRTYGIHDVEAGAFKESGTNVQTLILVVS